VQSRRVRFRGGTLIVPDVHDLAEHERRLLTPDGYRPATCPLRRGSTSPARPPAARPCRGTARDADQRRPLRVREPPARALSCRSSAGPVSSANEVHFADSVGLKSAGVRRIELSTSVTAPPTPMAALSLPCIGSRPGPASQAARRLALCRPVVARAVLAPRGMRLPTFFAVASLGLGCGGSTESAASYAARGGSDGSSLVSADARANGDSAVASSGAPCGFRTCGVQTVSLPQGGGCCLEDGGCFLPPAHSESGTPAAAGEMPCGSNGEACTICGPGESCIGGGCQRSLGTTCTPATCAGCCPSDALNSSSQCFDGSQDAFCGSRGDQCQVCSPSTNGGHCVANSSGGGGHCEGAGQCDETNCAGCCSGAVCAEGSQDIACGSNGAPCQNCTTGTPPGLAGVDGGVCVLFDVDNFDDGGVGHVCGYDCPAEGIGFCTTYCSSPSDCFGQGGP
jgi:hypothetical protein